MAWYYIVFLFALSLFILKTIISWVFGDIDVDFDVDGDTDFDVSSMFSFKGILHFLLGFSGYLSLVAKFSSSYTIGNYQFTIFEYISAVCVGILFTISLFFLYKAMMGLNHSIENNPNFNGCDCSILTNLGHGQYVVLIKTPVGVFKKTLYHIYAKPDIQIGSEHKIAKDIYHNNEYFII